MDVVEDLGGCDDVRLSERPAKFVLIPAAVIEVQLAKEPVALEVEQIVEQVVVPLRVVLELFKDQSGVVLRDVELAELLATLALLRGTDYIELAVDRVAEEQVGTSLIVDLKGLQVLVLFYEREERPRLLAARLEDEEVATHLSLSLRRVHGPDEDAAVELALLDESFGIALDNQLLAEVGLLLPFPGVELLF